ncbi:hypothetical protein TPA0907_27340 [Micromonospora humidisoli]|nr:hypothetical protein TPA0907_27340 [Micromonospora sp. AKA109]
MGRLPIDGIENGQYRGTESAYLLELTGQRVGTGPGRPAGNISRPTIRAGPARGLPPVTGR